MEALSTAKETGTSFVSGLENDTTVAINTVTITDGNGTLWLEAKDSDLDTTTPETDYVLRTVGKGGNQKSFDLEVTFHGDGTVTVSGLQAKDTITYTTVGQHNRVELWNSGDDATTLDWDIGGFRLTEVAADTDEIGSKIFFEDDGPSIAAGTDPNALTVDETTLGTDDSGSFAGLFSVSYGADGQAATGPLTYALGIGVADANSGLVDTATGNSVFLFLSADGTTITGKEGTSLADAGTGTGTGTGDTVFVIGVNASTGVGSLDQQRAVMHSANTGPDEAVTLADGVITLSATAKDGDLDTASRTENVGDRFTFKDDAPTAGANTAVQLDDETAQTTRAAPNVGGTGDASGTAATATGTLTHNFGADGAGTVLLTGATLPAVGGFSQILSADGTTLTISQTQNGVSVDVISIR
ncbi:DUF5801 repeats-in-toxin domain-containing protein [uncultured Paracoccus sp.]|uniref:DUF5801 repeats-in-toxin domain-containing protein n=1 Tax=uncultured Paracoccus sp. TaxID=189685 RepID=UPI002624367F|nr:DUF5801 repeats-in-toxin domain-containing protein [uncultured Paracoccus sp.]